MHPGDPLGSVYIGAREIYDAVQKVAAVTDVIAGRVEDISNDLKDHEVRLRSLERARWPLPALSILVAIAALALSVLKP